MEFNFGSLQTVGVANKKTPKVKAPLTRKMVKENPYFTFSDDLFAKLSLEANALIERKDLKTKQVFLAVVSEEEGKIAKRRGNFKKGKRFKIQSLHENLQEAGITENELDVEFVGNSPEGWPHYKIIPYVEQKEEEEETSTEEPATMTPAEADLPSAEQVEEAVEIDDEY